MSESEGLREAIELAINRHCGKNGSNTPDYVLASFLTRCLAAFDSAVAERDKWYGVSLSPGRSRCATCSGTGSYGEGMAACQECER